jgi:hypothetical protein
MTHSQLSSGSRARSHNRPCSWRKFAKQSHCLGNWENTVSLSRFAADEPSGFRSSVQAWRHEPHRLDGPPTLSGGDDMARIESMTFAPLPHDTSDTLVRVDQYSVEIEQNRIA